MAGQVALTHLIRVQISTPPPVVAYTKATIFPLNLVFVSDNGYEI